MKNFFIVFILGLLLISNSVFAKNFSTNSIAYHVNKTPRNIEDNMNSLVRYLTSPFDDKYDKARAIAFWIASRIHYDTYYYNNGESTSLIKNYNMQSPSKLMRSRVGICGDFANLFKTMCKKAGISSKIVFGYAYPRNTRLTRKNKENARHAWNVFYAQGRYIYVDTTFMSRGHLSTGKHISQSKHRRALNKFKNENKFKSVKNNFDSYYFDFDYKKEKRDRNYIHEER